MCEGARESVTRTSKLVCVTGCVSGHVGKGSHGASAIKTFWFIITDLFSRGYQIENGTIQMRVFDCLVIV